MSTSRDSCCLPSVKKQKHDFQVFAFVQCIIKQLLDSVFVISRIIKVSVRVISLSLRLRLITLTSTLIILDITKTSSNILFKIIRVISKSNECTARVRFEITSMISDQNCTTRSSITTLLDPFLNHTI